MSNRQMPNPSEVAMPPQPREGASRPAILHITADYPDLNKPVNTQAVKNFIDANPDADHFIISLNRTAYPWQFRITDGGGHGDPRVVSIRYLGLPFGIQLASSMYAVARLAHGIVTRRAVRFDVIHAHKLSFEGLVAYWLSRWTKKPFVCSLRGGTDERVLRFKPHYFPLYNRVVARAARLHYVSAWFRPEMRRRFGADPAKERLLPNFVHAERIVPQRQFQQNAFLSIMSFAYYEQKGLTLLLPAFKEVVARVPDASLDLVGLFGTPERLKHIQGLIDAAGLSASVRIVGSVEHQELLRRLGSYAGFVLPTRVEAFGMAYVEAILSGVPIVYSKGTGIDGFVDGIEGAIGIDPYSIASIRDGLLVLAEKQHHLREWLLTNRCMMEARFDARTHILAYNADVRALTAARESVSAVN
jgi:glycosyltransferase involved in cell wall biosynthesis